MLRDVDLSVGSETSLFCSDVVAFNAIFPSTRRERERQRVRVVSMPDCTQKGWTDVLSMRAASHSILLSTVQYLYVHPIVLTWVALPEKKKRSKHQILTLEDDSSPERCFSFPVRWLGHSTRRFSLQVGACRPLFRVPSLFAGSFFLFLHTVPASNVSGSIS